MHASHFVSEQERNPETEFANSLFVLFVIYYQEERKKKKAALTEKCQLLAKTDLR